jgi:hypothetical protein
MANVTVGNETVAKRIRTVPVPIKDYKPVIATGNDYISLPSIIPGASRTV